MGVKLNNYKYMREGNRFPVIEGGAGAEGGDEFVKGVGGNNEKREVSPGPWKEAVDGVLRIPHMGDINDPYNGDACVPDPKTGLNKIQTWLEVEVGPDGHCTRARIKNAKAYDDFVGGILEGGAAAVRAGRTELESTFRNVSSGVDPERITYDEFNALLSELIGSVASLRDQVTTWKLKKLKSHASEPNQFRLDIEFQPDAPRSRVNKRGTFDEIMAVMRKLAGEIALHAVNGER
jgi:hypothetical protein